MSKPEYAVWSELDPTPELDESAVDDFIRIVHARCKARQSPSGKVDGGKESCGPVAGVANPAKVAEQSKVAADASPAANVLQPVAPPPSPSSGAAVQSLSTDGPVSTASPAAAVVPPALVERSNPLVSAVSADDALALRLRLAEGLGGDDLQRRTFKRWYQLQNAGVATAIQLVADGNNNIQLLNAILGPQTVADNTLPTRRSGSAVRMHHLNLKFCTQKVPSLLTNPISSSTTPTIRVIVFADKVPAIIGTAPTVIASDGSPGPAPTPGIVNPLCVYSRLGQGAGALSMTAVRNPVSKPLYSVLHDRLIELPQASNIFGDTKDAVVGAAKPDLQYHHISLPLHSMPSIWEPDVLIGGPIINALWCSMSVDFVASGTTAGIFVSGYSWSISFTDMTTD